MIGTKTKMRYVQEFETENFIFLGGWAFYEDDSETVYLLSANGCHVLLDKELFGSLEKGVINDALKFKLVQFGLALTSDSRSVIDIYEERHCGSKDVYPSFFLIDVTKICNLDCIYCFRDLNDKHVIDNRVLKDICTYILDIIKAKDEKHVTIQLWGGEPLFAFDAIRYVHDFFEKNKIEANITIETNGTILDEKRAYELKKMNVSVGVSIDGLPSHQNMQRRLLGNIDKQTMPLVETGLRALEKYYGRGGYGVITVITKYNYMDIDKIIKHFIYDLNICSGKFNLVKDNRNAAEKSLKLNKEMIELFAEHLCDVVEAYNALGIEFREYNIEQRKNNLLKRDGSDCCDSNGCNGGFSIISFDSNGDIYPCELTDLKEIKMGSIYKNGILQNGKDICKVISDAKVSNKYFRKKNLTPCKDCPWIYFCKGGCTSRTLYISDDMEIDGDMCTYNRVVYKRLVHNIICGKI